METLLVSGLSFTLKIVNFKLAIVKRINVTCRMIDFENSKYCGLFEAVSYFRIHLSMSGGKTSAMFKKIFFVSLFCRPQKRAALGDRLVRLVVKPALLLPL